MAEGLSLILVRASALSLRTLSIGQMWPGSTTLERSEALASLRLDVTPFDITPYLKAGSWLGKRLHHRLLVGPNLNALNAALLETARAQGPFDIAWLDKANWIWPETLRQLRDHARLLIHNTPDTAFIENRSRHFHAGIPLYDLCITNKSFDLAAYRHYGARALLLLPQGAGSRFFNPETATAAFPWAAGISFIGHYEKHYDRVLIALAKAGLRLEIWGPGWPAARGGDPLLGPMIRGEGAFGADYVRAIQQSLIGLGLLSKTKPDRFTTRSFEIPAAGRLLLAERTEEHRLLFEEDKETSFFDDIDELVEKARALLADPNHALALADAGHRRVRENYQWHQVLAPALDALGLPVPPQARAALPNPLAPLAA